MMYGKKYEILFPEGKKKAFTLSYDDNQIYDRRLIEMMHEYNIKGTFHLNSCTFGKSSEDDTFISEEEIPALYKGMEVSCHGVHHPFFGQLSNVEKAVEILEDKRHLERIVRYPVRGMSYPFGEYSDDIIQVMTSCGMEYSRTVEDIMGYNWPADFMKWHPTCHHNKAFDNAEITRNFLNCPSYLNLPLFYVWGHSFEFERENTWSKMEAFLKDISGHDDIWYATNIQIKDYICAVRSLKFSADHDMIYNPSAVTVFLEVNKTRYSIKPLETFMIP